MEEKGDDVLLMTVDGLMERGATVGAWVLDVWVGAALEEKFGDLVVSAATGVVEGGVAVGVDCVEDAGSVGLELRKALQMVNDGLQVCALVYRCISRSIMSIELQTKRTFS